MKWPFLFLAVLLTRGFALAGQIVETEVCVYGGAAGGVTAAVQVARLGKTVSLVVFNRHLGGLSSGGLGQTDIGNNGNAYIQGIAREFYTRIGAKYNQAGAKFTFEPKVAERVFDEMAREAGVPVYFDQRLASTTMEGGRITQITMESGDVFRAKMFLDASYEGDLLKQAGVSYTVGREANSQYGETINGIQTATSGNQLPNGIDPYVVPRDSSSGLLAGINPGPVGANGSADTLIQAFCYRMCLTNVAANRIMVTQPAGYKEADYELLFRAIQAGQTGAFWKVDAMPNGKTDSNNASGFSCDLIGGNLNYAEASYAARDEMARAHERWQRGLIWTVQNHPRVPAAIRNAWSQWGLPADEFLDTGHWPHQLYVREARRMISDYVMTEKNCLGTATVEDSIAMGAYTMDSHNCQRIVLNGMVKNEGDIQRPVPAPYPIAYRSIVPKKGECENLLVPWSLSSTHIAFGSIRMEPVFMNVGQSAATAACFAIDDGVAVQNVAYPRLRAQLLADRQLLTTSGGANEVIVDNTDSGAVTIVGAWTASSSTAGYHGPDYLHDANIDKGTKSVRFTPTLPSAGSHQVFLRWTAFTNRASNVPVEVRHAEGSVTVAPLIDQRQNGAQWVLLGTYPFKAGSSPETGSVTVHTTGTNGFVIADAVRFNALSALPSVSLWSTDAVASEPSGAGPALGKITLSRTGSTSAVLNVTLAVGGSATNGIDYPPLPATVTFPAGAATVVLPVTAFTDSLSEGDETLTVNVVAGNGYLLDPLNGATVTLRDRPPAAASGKSRFIQKLENGMPQKIVVYGTSLTAGGAWSGQMKAALDAAYPGLTTLINSGGSGMASDWGALNVQSKVIAQNPDAVFIEFAVNDAVERFHLSLTQARANLQAIVSEIQRALPMCEIIFQVTNPVIDRPEGDAGWRPNLRLYQEIYRAMGAANGLLVIDHSAAWQAVLDQGEAAYHAVVPDGLHPNAQGYERFVTPVILQAIGAPASIVPALIVDNADAAGVVVTGNWTAGAVTNAGQYGPDYLHDANTGKGSNSVRFVPALPYAGYFPVYLRWTADPNRATNVPVEIRHAGGTATLSVNQQQQGGQWVLLGSYLFEAGTSGNVLIRTDATNGFVVADAMGVGVPAVTLRVSNGLVAEPAGNGGPARSTRVTVLRSGSTINALTVDLALGGSATNGIDYAALPATVTIPAGMTSVSIDLLPMPDTRSEGDESVSISAATGTGYLVASPAKATVSILDRPFDAWKHAHFSPEQLATPALAGDVADPDGDSVVNLVEYLLGGAPMTPDAAGFNAAGTVQIGSHDYLAITFQRVSGSDLLCIPEVSADLATWRSDTVHQTLLADDGLIQTITARDTVPIEPSARRFLRLRVLRDPAP